MEELLAILPISDSERHFDCSTSDSETENLMCVSQEAASGVAHKKTMKFLATF
uniref:Uncharacterized protein n=1 Tax=Arundo donax TaxID=35708 RepID=A0A0A9BWZ6_ARUDO